MPETNAAWSRMTSRAVSVKASATSGLRVGADEPGADALHRAFVDLAAVGGGLPPGGHEVVHGEAAVAAGRLHLEGRDVLIAALLGPVVGVHAALPAAGRLVGLEGERLLLVER